MASFRDDKSAHDDTGALGSEADDLHSLIPGGESVETPLDDEPIDFVALAALSQPGARTPPPPPPQATSRGTLRPAAAPQPGAGATLPPAVPALSQASPRLPSPPQASTGGTLRPPPPALSQPVAREPVPAPAPLPAAAVAASPGNLVGQAPAPARSEAAMQQPAVVAEPAPSIPFAESVPRLAEPSVWSEPPEEPPTYLRSSASSKRWILGLAIGFALGVPVGAFFFGAAAAPQPAPAKSPALTAAARPAAGNALGTEAVPAPSIAAPAPPPERSPEPTPTAAAAPALAPVAQAKAALAEPIPVVAPPPTAASEPAAPGLQAVASALAQRNPVSAQIPARSQPAPSAQPMPRALAAREPAASAAPPAEHVVVRTQPAPAQIEAPVLAIRPVVERQPPPTAAPEPASQAPVAPAKSRVDSVLDDALANPADKAVLARQQEAIAAQTELPDAPSREDVGKAMTVLLPAIRGCAMGQSGLATAGIVVRNDGRVASVTVAGAPFENASSGRCMEGVVRRARFPRFKQPSFRVQFPFAIQ